MLFAWPVLALTPKNSGFIPGQIWYSKDSLVEGEMVNIHTAVWNNENESLSTKVEFYDKNVILGSREVIVNSFELKDVYIPWKITSGDHTLSAKIISSALTISGKKETIVLNRITTSTDKQFVPVVVKNIEGAPVTETDLLKNQINKTTSEINNIIPEGVSTSISGGFSSVDNFRTQTLSKVDSIKKEVEKQINLAKNSEVKPTNTVEKSSLLDSIQTPIGYLKLFLFSILAFILGSKIIFYGLLIFCVFLILRFIYHRIQNR